MHNTYSIYGLTVRVPFICKSLTPALFAAAQDVIVEDGAVPRTLPDAVLAGAGWQATPERVLLHSMDSVGRFLVAGGERITLQRAPTAADEVLAVQFLDVALAIVLQQRRYAVLHAALPSRPPAPWR